MTRSTQQTAFEEFWAVYPRRVGKIDAMKAWEKALKLATAETIIAAVEFQRGYWNDPKYIPYPATWLRAGRWMDEMTAPRNVLGSDGWRCRHIERCSNREMCQAATILGRPERAKEAS